MISANDPKEKACAIALQAIAHYANQAAHDPTINLDDKMKMLQWIDKKIPEVIRLMIYIKTKGLNP